MVKAKNIQKPCPELKKFKPKIVRILKKNGITKAGIFGSYARGEVKKTSDIDILIRPGKGKFSLMDLVGIELELKKELRKNIDILTYNGINPMLKKQILKEEVKII